MDTLKQLTEHSTVDTRLGPRRPLLLTKGSPRISFANHAADEGVRQLLRAPDPAERGGHLRRGFPGRGPGGGPRAVPGGGGRLCPGRRRTRVFTLSALAKSYSVSLTNDENPIKPSTHEDFRPVRNRAAFARAYWEKINDIFGKRWTNPEQPGEDFGKYLTDKREKKIVCFSAIFLEALGHVGYALGQQCGWSAEAPDLELLEKLRTLEYDPSKQPKWRSLMMKESSKESDNGEPTYVFNNVLTPRNQRLGTAVGSDRPVERLGHGRGGPGT